MPGEGEEVDSIQSILADIDTNYIVTTPLNMFAQPEVTRTDYKIVEMRGFLQERLTTLTG